MDSGTKSIIIGGVTLLIIAVILGLAIYFVRFSARPNVTGRSSIDVLPTLPPAGTTVSPVRLPTIIVKLYAGQGFTLDYPSRWGLLTCSNSKNIEFDPYSSTDSKNVACDLASKPVTILVVDKLNCQGTVSRIGNSQVVKIKNTTDGDTAYRWCVTLGNKNFDITHRVSQRVLRATSKDDFSAQIEKMIGTFKTVPQGS